MRTIPLRFSLLGLMVAVVLAAVACAALRYASELWASAVLTAAIGMLLVSVLGMVLRRGPVRAFWFGFTLFGSAYLILVFAPWCSVNVRPQLVTSKVLAYLHPRLQTAGSPLLHYGFRVIGRPGHRLAVSVDGGTPTVESLDVTIGQQLVATLGDSDVVSSVAFSPDGRLLAPGTGHRMIVWGLASTQRPTWEHFERVGHSLFGLLVALVGGVLARYMFARRSLIDGGSGSGADCSC
ncbi:MAG: hypothetical protein HY000_22290 [Planctomycetes bacterium]|nr:hypothetical protein [Planctomycetota bacterium]